jgi:hypothetical protein
MSLLVRHGQQLRTHHAPASLERRLQGLTPAAAVHTSGDPAVRGAVTPAPAADKTLKPCRARRRGDGATKRGRCCHCFVLSLATLAALAGAGLFIAGAILQVLNPTTAL